MRRSVLAAGLLVLVACASGAGDVAGLSVLSETGAQVDGANVRLVANVDSESAPLRVTVDWGDGTTDVLSDVAPGAISARHVYVSAGDFTIVLEAATPEGGTQVAAVEVTIEESAIAAPATTSPTPTSTAETTPSTEATTTTEATATTTTQATTTTSSAPVTGGDLLYYRLRLNRTSPPQFDVTGLKIGAGWAKFKTVIGGWDPSFSDVVLYAITEDGDLLYYRHPAYVTGEGQFDVTGVKIGAGWDQFETVTAGGKGILYAVTEEGDLLYYRHPANLTGEGQFDVTGLKIGAGWDQFETVIGGVLRCSTNRPGVLYAITEGGDLLYYRHPANLTGEGQFEVTGLKIGAGWDRFETVLSGGLACRVLGPQGPGFLYAITEGGDLLYYRHPANVTGEGQFEVTGLKIGAGWDQFRTVTSGPLTLREGFLHAVTEP